MNIKFVDQIKQRLESQKIANGVVNPDSTFGEEVARSVAKFLNVFRDTVGNAAAKDKGFSSEEITRIVSYLTSGGVSPDELKAAKTWLEQKCTEFGQAPFTAVIEAEVLRRNPPSAGGPAKNGGTIGYSGTSSFSPAPRTDDWANNHISDDFGHSTKW